MRTRILKKRGKTRQVADTLERFMEINNHPKKGRQPGSRGEGFCLPFLIALVTILAFFLLYRGSTDPWARKVALETHERMTALQSVPNIIADWPPAVGKRFPEIKLYNHDGSSFDLHSLRGKPVLLELIAMSCAGCQAFSGGNVHGGFGGFPAQSDLKAIEDYYEHFTGGQKLFSERINFVQIIVYNLELAPATSVDAAKWRKHFHLDKSNTHVLVGEPALANGDTFRMIPGFILMDSKLTVLFDSTGHHPRHNLYTELLPGARTLVSRHGT